jgi:hypothetical protein
MREADYALTRFDIWGMHGDRDVQLGRRTTDAIFESDLTATDPVTFEIKKSVHLHHPNDSDTLSTRFSYLWRCSGIRAGSGGQRSCPQALRWPGFRYEPDRGRLRSASGRIIDATV